MNFLIFLGTFLGLFLVSRLFTSELGQFFVRKTKNPTLTIHLLAIVFFPGVLIHELGHFLMASILFVHTGEIEFLPKVQEDGIKLGSVAIGRTDPIRRLLIGVAPVVSGIGLLFLASYYLVPLWPISWKTLVFCYVLFEIGNTMFSSKKDLEGALGFLLLLIFIGICLFVLGARIPSFILAYFLSLAASDIFLQMALWIGGSLLLNSTLFLFLKLVDRRRY